MADALDRALVIGVDFGTLPDQALVVRGAAGLPRGPAACRPGRGPGMGRLNCNAYEPVPANARTYDALYAEYTKLHDYFGRGGNDVMHRLGDLRRKAHAARQGAQT